MMYNNYVQDDYKVNKYRKTWKKSKNESQSKENSD